MNNSDATYHLLSVPSDDRYYNMTDEGWCRGVFCNVTPQIRKPQKFNVHDYNINDALFLNKNALLAFCFSIEVQIKIEIHITYSFLTTDFL